VTAELGPGPCQSEERVDQSLSLRHFYATGDAKWNVTSRGTQPTLNSLACCHEQHPACEQRFDSRKNRASLPASAEAAEKKRNCSVSSYVLILVQDHAVNEHVVALTRIVHVDRYANFYPGSDRSLI
jgi:hypothetical protein